MDACCWKGVEKFFLSFWNRSEDVLIGYFRPRGINHWACVSFERDGGEGAEHRSGGCGGNNVCGNFEEKKFFCVVR